ncbi:FtsQ-type POTRA domain-containing protein [Clostridium sp. MB40-C1]|uniref:cell division protein FtsQ/DivIB n=1 Tax=Clostridium sp. MB40-C1 TaxID=3070996 RepID=UPI0027E0F7D7|nr:FtsQ-type POTRA domain-containing protein [Clostridium sp. MB40-C1]WMJ81368.1 FtsQ-type POTRA domain-containing protein [Clostridium sp. MB40-C1]
MSKNKNFNELIERRRKKIKIKRYIGIFVILVAVVITLCLKLPYFNVKSIEVLNNRNITSPNITKLSQINIGDNIFYLNLKKSKENVLSNPYILDANIRRKMPNKIIIDVEERDAVFYVMQDNKYLVIDKEGIVLEEKNSISGMKLLRLEGFKKKDYELGKVLDKTETRKIEIISQITELIDNLKKGVPEPSIVDITDITDIKVYYKNIVVKIGTSDNLREKLNKAINILLENNLINKKGYIDVSFKGSPVFLVEG